MWLLNQGWSQAAVLLDVIPGFDSETGQRSPGLDRRLPREIDHVVLRGLEPAPPPAGVQVHLLQPPGLLLLPHLHHIGAGELHTGAGAILILEVKIQ